MKAAVSEMGELFTSMAPLVSDTDSHKAAVNSFLEEVNEGCPLSPTRAWSQ
jgi:hypothetical protein